MTTTNEKTYADLWEWIKTVRNSDGTPLLDGDLLHQWSNAFRLYRDIIYCDVEDPEAIALFDDYDGEGDPALMLFARLASALENYWVSIDGSNPLSSPSHARERLHRIALDLAVATLTVDE